VLDVASGVCTQVVLNDTGPSTRNNHTTAVMDQRLIVHGGHDGNKWVADMHILDTSSASTGCYNGLTWSKGQTSGVSPPARACHTLTRLAHKLYMFGGYDGAKCFNDMDILDVETMTWIQPALSGTQPQARNAHTMTVIAAKLFLFGGHSGNKHLTDLHVFDTQKLQWSQPEILGTPPPGLRGHTANLIGYKIFLFGGYDGKGRTNELYVLDVENSKWVRPSWSTESLHTPPGRQRHSASLIGSKKIYIFGGFDGNKWLNDLHVLDVGRLEESALSDVAVHRLIENMRKLLNSQDFSDITLADHYTLDGLKHVCENVLVHSVEVETVCTLLRCADQYMAQELKRYCLTFILKHFNQVAHTQAFTELSLNPMLLLEVTRAAATKDHTGGAIGSMQNMGGMGSLGGV